MTREEMLKEIVERELLMFQSAPSQGGPAICQKRPATFRLMRNMAHCAHGNDFLASYLDDLRQAEASGRNFMTEKYARMDDLIPPLNDSPLLDEIVLAECKFLEEAAKKLPGRIRSPDNGIFPIYLRSELETLSERSLRLYAEEIRNALRDGKNPVLERHLWLSNAMGATNKGQEDSAI